MRHQFKFLGIKQPKLRALFKTLIKQQGQPTPEQLPQVLQQLWAWPEREFQYIGCDLLDRSPLTPDLLPTVEHLIIHKAWWDTVDPLATHTVAQMDRQFPNEAQTFLQRWRGTENLWLRRTVILFQLSYKAETDVELLFAVIRENRESTEFFLQKAMGWALREYSKTDAAQVTQFVAEQPLPALTQREALKWLKRQKQQG